MKFFFDVLRILAAAGVILTLAVLVSLTGSELLVWIFWGSIVVSFALFIWAQIEDFFQGPPGAE